MIWRILGVVLLLLVALTAFIVWSHRPLSPDTLQSEYMTEADRFVSAAGSEWRVRETGPESAPAIVLIHGFSHSLESFDAWAVDLQTDHRVIRFDLPGHALTGPRDDAAYSNAATTEQVAALLDEIAPERFVIGGNSLGGLIAWRYAAMHPDRVDGLVLISSGGYPNLGVGDEPLEAPGAVQFFLRTAPAAGVQQATAALYGDPSRITPERLERIRDLMRTEGVGEALIERISQFTLPDPEPMLAQISAPALILWGAADVMIPSEHAARYEAALADAEAVVLDGVGHMAMEEAPEETLPILRRFLDGLGAEADTIAAE
ncbi:MAG: alpha/beta fold hydrolase [Pseudomonadota bacterium]